MAITLLTLLALLALVPIGRVLRRWYRRQAVRRELRVIQNEAYRANQRAQRVRP